MNTTIVHIPIPHLCVVTAADLEFRAVSRRLEERIYTQTDGLKTCQGRAGRNLITVLQSEIGARGFKEKLTALLRANSYDAVLILGLAGALTPDLKTGEVIFYDTCFSFRPEMEITTENEQVLAADQTSICDFQISSALRQSLLADGLECMFGTGLTLDFMVTSAEEKLAMGESYGAAAVDMESYDVISVATELGLPTIVLRVILDEAEQKTPDFNMALSAEGKLNNVKSLLAMAMRPFAAVRFLYSLVRAQRVLAHAARLALQTEAKILRPSQALVLARKMSV
ncbi:MAG TPA: hypothetical protein VFZ34_20815 [Blastocatellia bacterium]|nr:hypothetical protein [Blastocatellia bacterium]